MSLTILDLVSHTYRLYYTLHTRTDEDEISMEIFFIILLRWNKIPSTDAISSEAKLTADYWLYLSHATRDTTQNKT